MQKAELDSEAGSKECVQAACAAWPSMTEWLFKGEKVTARILTVALRKHKGAVAAGLIYGGIGGPFLGGPFQARSWILLTDHSSNICCTILC